MSMIIQSDRRKSPEFNTDQDVYDTSTKTEIIFVPHYERFFLYFYGDE